MWVAFRLTFSTIALILFAFDFKKQNKAPTRCTYTVRGWFAENTLFFNANSCISTQPDTRTNGAAKKREPNSESIDWWYLLRAARIFVLCLFYLCNHKSFVIACTITLLVAFSLSFSYDFYHYNFEYSHGKFIRIAHFRILLSFQCARSLAAICLLKTCLIRLILDLKYFRHLDIYGFERQSWCRSVAFHCNLSHQQIKFKFKT